jgi:rhomboid family GlyGly-CTERM serine protease
MTPVNRNPNELPHHLLHLLPIIITVIAIVLSIGGESVTELLRYQTDKIHEGEVWRLVTGNLVHLGWGHLFLNLLGLGLIWGLFWGCFSPLAWSAISLISALAVGLGLFWLDPQLVWYVGLSGMLHGLFVAGAVGGIRRGDRREAILLVALVGKLLWEQAYGALPGSADVAGGPVIVDSHLYGAIGGAIAALLFKPVMYCESD